MPARFREIEMEITPEYLSALIGAIYDCALDPDLWEPTLTELTRAFMSQTAVLGLTDLGRQTALASRIVGMEPRWQNVLERHGPEIHSFTAPAYPTLESLDEPFIVSRRLSPEYRATSPYYHEVLKAWGLVDVIQLMVISTPTRLAGLGFGRGEAHGMITDREIKLARMLLPHVRRAITVTDVLDANVVARERVEDTFNLFDCAIVLIDAQGGILFANRSAEEMFAAGTMVRGNGGVLRAVSPSAAAELRTAIALAAGQEAEIGKAGLAIQLAGDDPPSLLAHVLPLTGSQRRANLQPAAVAAVFIRKADIALEPALEVLARLHKLTGTELRVLQAIVDKGGVPEVATALGISESTVRTHLKRLFEKTATHRQVDLVKLVAAHANPLS
jgi:DNA-binding CsgD family transcriptional regulator/PAS domain-containing protein